MNGFANKIAVVTGGASGIGKAICVYLAQRGAQVVIADRDLAGAQEVERLVAVLPVASAQIIKTMKKNA